MSNTNWSSLPANEQSAIFPNINVGQGIIFPQNADFDFSGKVLVDIDPSNMTVSTPSQTSSSYSEIIESEFKFKLKQCSLSSTDVNAGIKGTIEELDTEIGGNVSVSSSTSSENTSQSFKKSYYLYAEYSVTQKTLSIDSTSLSGKLTDNFLNEIKTVTQFDKQDVNLQGMLDLINVLNTWGWYLPISLTMGGKITYWDINEVTSDSDTSQLEQSFTSSASASIGVPLVAEASTDTTNTEKHSTETSESSYLSTANAKRLVVGGSSVGADPSELSAWLKSLDDPSQWRTVEMTLAPTLSFVPDDVYQQISKLQSQYSGYDAVKQIADIDPQSYFKEVESARGYASGW